MSKPLPPTFIHGASAFWVPMEPQPKGDVVRTMEGEDEEIVYRDMKNGCAITTGDGEDEDCIHPPHAVGDILYEREEWRVFPDEYDDYTVYLIQFRDGSKRPFPSGQEFLPVWDKVWQPASTMPSWAARKRYTVATVESKQVKDVSNNEWDNCGFASKRDCNFVHAYLSLGIDKYVPDGGRSATRDDWGWYVTLTESKGEDNEC